MLLIHCRRDRYIPSMMQLEEVCCDAGRLYLPEWKHSKSSPSPSPSTEGCTYRWVTQAWMKSIHRLCADPSVCEAVLCGVSRPSGPGVQCQKDHMPCCRPMCMPELSVTQQLLKKIPCDHEELVMPAWSSEFVEPCWPSSSKNSLAELRTSTNSAKSDDLNFKT